jgi:hypothetical protein
MTTQERDEAVKLLKDHDEQFHYDLVRSVLSPEYRKRLCAAWDSAIEALKQVEVDS